MSNLLLTPNEHVSPIQDERITIRAEAGDLVMRLIKPVDTLGFVPVVLYVCRENRTRDGASTGECLARDFALGARSAVIFIGDGDGDGGGDGDGVSYSADRRLGQVYAAVRWITAHGASNGLDASRLVIAGDRLDQNEDASEILFADGPHISGRAMAWFWAHYPAER